MAAHRRSLKDRLRLLYEGTGKASQRLRWLMLATDVALVAFFLATTFVEHGPWLVIVDYAIGTVLLAEWMVRLWVARDRLDFAAQPIVMLDLAVILSLFAPAITENFVFLRILRALRLLRSYHMLRQLRQRHRFFHRHESVIFAATNFLVFVFIIAAIVYALQARINPQIGNYVDALYFTVTTLTTTGFGDIIMLGTVGRLLAVIIMIVGVSLFLRLLQAIFRASKVNYECPDCGLSRHDADAVHCKHCGHLLHIPTEGQP